MTSVAAAGSRWASATRAAFSAWARPASALARPTSPASLRTRSLYFSVLRTSRVAQAFLDGAGPAAIGATLGSAILLAGTLREPWQFAVLAGTAVLLLGPDLPVVRRGVVFTLLAAAASGLLVALAGGPLPH
jgi:chromate transporter